MLAKAILKRSSAKWLICGGVQRRSCSKWKNAIASWRPTMRVSLAIWDSNPLGRSARETWRGSGRLLGPQRANNAGVLNKISKNQSASSLKSISTTRSKKSRGKRWSSVWKRPYCNHSHSARTSNLLGIRRLQIKRAWRRTWRRPRRNCRNYAPWQPARTLISPLPRSTMRVYGVGTQSCSKLWQRHSSQLCLSRTNSRTQKSGANCKRLILCANVMRSWRSTHSFVATETPSKRFSICSKSRRKKKNSKRTRHVSKP
mmetsp:Transcript_59296/g.95901  ORF Transcript_59296/g.95901 Transcript_59296/m.95901 type:complete len:258 (-) Transcript_59296:175-948(-)